MPEDKYEGARVRVIGPSHRVQDFLSGLFGVKGLVGLVSHEAIPDGMLVKLEARRNPFDESSLTELAHDTGVQLEWEDPLPESIHTISIGENVWHSENLSGDETRNLKRLRDSIDARIQENPLSQEMVYTSSNPELFTPAMREVVRRVYKMQGWNEVGIQDHSEAGGGPLMFSVHLKR